MLSVNVYIILYYIEKEKKRKEWNNMSFLILRN